jgi:hypothetical protein
MKKWMGMPQSGRKWFSGNQYLSMLLILCMGYGVIPIDAQKASKPTLYKGLKATKGHFDTPYRATPDGEVIGEMPKTGIYEVVAIEGDWAKVKYKGGEYYIKKELLKKVEAPEVVCSAWAKEWFSYDGIYRGTVGEWNGVADDWTKPITRAEMADMLVINIMESVYGNWEVKSTLPGAIKSNGGNYFTDSKDFQEGRLAYWGIVPTGKFNPTGSITCDEFTKLLVKLMAYDKRYIRQGGGSEFTKADITKFAIGGNKAPTAKCTKEQAKILCDKVLCWRQEMALITGAKFEDGNYDGTMYVYNGAYTIKTMLGKKPNQPHLFVNAEGKVELNSSKKQQFKITYKKSMLNKDRNVMHLYTIQTTDGKYLGISGTPVNGSRLIAQKNEFLWWIETGSSEDGQATNFIEDPNNYHQVLNVSGWKTNDRTPIISGFWRHGTGADANNCKFIFSKVK